MCVQPLCMQVVQYASADVNQLGSLTTVTVAKVCFDVLAWMHQRRVGCSSNTGSSTVNAKGIGQGS